MPASIGRATRMILSHDMTGLRHRRANRSACEPSMGRGRLRPAACWPGGWWSTASRSWRWSPTAGTPTRTTSSGWPNSAGQVDRPYAALVRDLEQRGLIDDTLVIWMGEFGRTPQVNPRGGRDHFPRSFNAVLAGGGIAGGGDRGADRPGGRGGGRPAGDRARPVRHVLREPRHRPGRRKTWRAPAGRSGSSTAAQPVRELLS